MGTEWINAFAQLGFPVAVAVYLLLRQSKHTEQLIRAQGEVKIGLYLILSKLGAIEEYERRVDESRRKKVEEEA